MNKSLAGGMVRCGGGVGYVVIAPECSEWGNDRVGKGV